MEPPRFFIRVLAAVLLLALAPVASAGDTIKLKWNDLATALAGRTVQVKTLAGDTFTGTVPSVEADRLRIQTKKSVAEVKRADVARIRIKGQSNKGRAIGMLLGLGLSLPSAIVSDGPTAARVAVVPVYGVIGFGLGWLADRNSGTNVVIVP